MADVIGLINDISPSVKLAWIAILAWAAVQFVWYRRARVLPGEAESLAARWSTGRQFPSVTRPPETDPIEAPSPGESRPTIAAFAPIENDVDANAEVEIAFASDELAEFEEPGTSRGRSNRRRRSTANSTPGAGVAGFALQAPKVN
jgi:hypothetical protein